MSPPSSRNLVLAKLRGSDQTVVRDITDIAHPSTIATLDVPPWQGSGFGSLQFINAEEISYTTDTSGSQKNQLIRMPLSGSPRTVIAAPCGRSYVLAIGWDSTGESATYLIDLQPGFDWRLQTGGTDRSLSNPPAWCYCGAGSEDGSVSVAFSPDGRFVSMVDGVGWKGGLVSGRDLQIRRIDGSLVTEVNAPLFSATMGVWSGDNFYFRDASNVKVWHEGLITTVQAGLSWLRPKASPGGGQVVFYTRGSDGLARVSLLDTKTGATRRLSDQARISPVFLSSRYVWYQGERLCAAGDQCVFNHTVLTGTSFIYDMTTGTETESVITDVAAVWPDAS